MGLPLLLAPPTFLCGAFECPEAQACANPADLRFAPDSKFTITRQFGLVCESDYIVSVLEMVFLLGLIAGAYFWGWAATNWGRKTTLIVTQVINSSAFFAAVVAPNIECFYLISWVAGFVLDGMLVADVILLSEFVDSDYRNWYAATSFSGWGIGAAAFAAVASAAQNWTTVSLASGAASLALIPLLFWLDESPLFLASISGNKSAVETVLRRIAYYNGRSVTTLPELAVEEEHEVSAKALFQGGWVRDRLVRISVIWFSAVLGYYGILFCLPTYMGDIYLNAEVMGLSEIPANILTAIFLSSLGRKPTMQTLFFAAALACLVAQVAEFSESATLQTVALSAARLTMTALYSLINLYTPELFPTALRGLAMGACGTVGNLGALASPLLSPLSKVIGLEPLFIISLCLCFGFCAGWGSEETKGVNLADVGAKAEQSHPNYVPLPDA